ncbi:three-helix bundle dimerization domain-containing protein [Agromyces sp. SYSU T0242]|uniref:three-helix bundle dimerization domain-containing protein n=1 Tax=Agromyces litoreus TaxID=3158561 RepID=UPI003393D9B7
MINEPDEDQAIESVVVRMMERFPSTSRDRVHAVVDEEHHRYDGRPVRDFVPVLVERAARHRLEEDGSGTDAPAA